MEDRVLCPRSSSIIRSAPALVCLALLIAVPPVPAAEEPNASGTLIANGETVELPYAYVWAEEEGFYDPSDPTWTLLFVEHPIEEHELDEHMRDSAWVEIGLTETSEFGDEPELHVLSHSLKLSADSGGNLTGADDPVLELEASGPDRFAGRIYVPEEQEFFDDTYQYDLTFDATLSDPDAPIGEPLPDDGGEPGRAYLRWVEAVHSGDPEELAALVPSEMATQLRERPAEEVQEEIEFMQLMTPTEVTILGGSHEGETAILQVKGTMEGEEVTGEITLTKTGDHWMPTKTSW